MACITNGRLSSAAATIRAGWLFLQRRYQVVRSPPGPVHPAHSAMPENSPGHSVLSGCEPPLWSIHDATPSNQAARVQDYWRECAH